MSKELADELETGSDVFGFDAMRGVQAGREFYIAMCPMKIIPKLFVFSESDLPPEVRAQRTLKETRIPAIRDYILNNPNDYVFSSLTASVDGNMRFSPAPALGENGKSGRLYISMNSKLLINDGQHRRRAIEEALKERPDLGHEMISVVFFQDSGLKRSQQMFSDLNKNAVKPTKSLNILYDHRDKFSRFVVDMTSTVEIFKDKVELEKTTISNRSTNAFTLNGISDATLHLFGIKKTRKLTKDEEVIAKEFWELVSKYIPEWGLLLEKKISAADMRKEFVHGNTNTLNALGIVGRVLIRDYPENWKEKLKGLRNVDWSRENSDWEGRLLLKGRMLKNALGVELAANTILQKCGIELSEDRQKHENKNA